MDMFYDNIIKNRKEFNDLVNKSVEEKALNKKLDLLSKAAFFGTYNTCGRLNSKAIEKELLNIAKDIHCKLKVEPEENSVLHVLTACWITGGHTQVVRRWIENSPKNQKHSVVFTNQPNPKTDTPQKLINAIKEKNGEKIFFNNEDTFIEKAIKLRKLASKYDKIVLHVHMDDIVPILAFGTEEFKRPIVFFNHADHLFWLGVSISDLVVNFRNFSKNINQKYRGIDRNFTIPLPIDEANMLLYKDKQISLELKRSMGFNENSTVILSMASAYKYTPTKRINFGTFALNFLKKNSSAVFLVIGPDKSEPYWNNLYVNSQGRINPIGYISNDDLEKYLILADIAIDSMPIPSFVALMDIAKYNIPVLTVKNPIGEIDAYIDAGICLSNIQELEIELEKIVNDRESYINKLYDTLKKHHFSKSHSNHLVELYNNFPQTHRLYDFNDDDRIGALNFEIFIEQSKEEATNKNQTQEYDLICSIGEDCACTMYLRQHHLQKFSYPFDWLTKATFKSRIECVINDFEFFFDKEDFKIIPKPKDQSTDASCDYYENVKTGFYFYNDFSSNENFNSVFSNIKEKYKRRAKRLLEAINSSSKVLFVWWGRSCVIGEKELIDAQKLLSKKFPNTTIDLLILESSLSLEYYYEKISDNIVRHRYDIRHQYLNNVSQTTLGNEEITNLILDKYRIKLNKVNIIKNLFKDTKEKTIKRIRRFIEVKI